MPGTSERQVRHLRPVGEADAKMQALSPTPPATAPRTGMHHRPELFFRRIHPEKGDQAQPEAGRKREEAADRHRDLLGAGKNGGDGYGDAKRVELIASPTMSARLLVGFFRPRVIRNVEETHRVRVWPVRAWFVNQKRPVADVVGMTTIDVGQRYHGSPTGDFAFCAKISAATVSSLFGEKVTLLGPWPRREFAKIVNGSVSGVTLNYDFMGKGTTSSNLAALGKAKGVSHFVVKPYASIGGTTYSFTDTFSDTTLGTKIQESGMVSYNGSNHYGLVVTKVLSTSTLAKLMTLNMKAA